MDSLPKGIRIKNGEPMVVIRPRNPTLAISLADSIVRRQKAGKITAAQAGREFDDILSKQTYMFVGFHSSDGQRIIIGDGLPTQDLKPGDSFVRARDLSKFEKTEETVHG